MKTFRSDHDLMIEFLGDVFAFCNMFFLSNAGTVAHGISHQKMMIDKYPSYLMNMLFEGVGEFEEVGK